MDLIHHLHAGLGTATGLPQPFRAPCCPHVGLLCMS